MQRCCLFIFPRVSNSRWPGDASSLVLLHEQFSTWSISYSECPDSGVSRCIRSHLHFFSVPQWHTWTRTVSHQHTYLHIHTDIYIADSYKCEQRTFGDISQMQCMNFCFISFLCGKTLLISKCKKKKKERKKKHSMRPSYFFQSGSST